MAPNPRRLHIILLNLAHVWGLFNATCVRIVLVFGEAEAIKRVHMGVEAGTYTPTDESPMLRSPWAAAGTNAPKWSWHFHLTQIYGPSVFSEGTEHGQTHKGFTWINLIYGTSAKAGHLYITLVLRAFMVIVYIRAKSKSQDMIMEHQAEASGTLSYVNSFLQTAHDISGYYYTFTCHSGNTEQNFMCYSDVMCMYTIQTVTLLEEIKLFVLKTYHWSCCAVW